MVNYRGFVLEDFDPRKNTIDGSRFHHKEIALTFDDGPHYVHSKIVLNHLKDFRIPAGFFPIGSRIIPATVPIIERIIEDGHSIGLHCWSHVPWENPKILMQSKELLEKFTKSPVNMVRFPFGMYLGNSKTKEWLKENRMFEVAWNVNSFDWIDFFTFNLVRLSPQQIVQNVLRQIDKKGKGIILFHDDRKNTADALPKILEEVLQRGYRFVLPKYVPSDEIGSIRLNVRI